MAAYLPEKQGEFGALIASRDVDQPPCWHIERARIGNSRKVSVELVVNAQPVEKREIVADGNWNELAFTCPIQRSSWGRLKGIGFFIALLVVSHIMFGADKKPSANSVWISLFDGKTLNGWKASQYEDSFSVRDGMIVAQGKPFSHLFYVGKGNGGVFKDFELKVDVMTRPNSNGGIYFHTQYQAMGWPAVGFEAQVNNTFNDKKKTGSLYLVKDVLDAPAKDNEWFTESIIVKGNHVLVKVSDKVVVDWTQPDNWQGVLDGRQLGEDLFPERKLASGTFALQAHDEHSVVYYKNIVVKPLP